MSLHGILHSLRAQSIIQLSPSAGRRRPSSGIRASQHVGSPRQARRLPNRLLHLVPRACHCSMQLLYLCTSLYLFMKLLDEGAGSMIL